jgi:glycosyltransferase involved in cell wall biosynthesis
VKIALAADVLSQWQGGRDFFRMLLESLEQERRPSDSIRVVAEPIRDSWEWRLARVGWRIATGRANRDWLRIELTKQSTRQRIRQMVAGGARQKILWRSCSTCLGNPRDRFDAVGPIQRPMKWGAGIGAIGYIPDLQHRILPHFFTKAECEERDQTFQWIIGNAHVVIVTSRDARSNLEKFYRINGCEIVVVPVAVRPRQEWLEADVSQVRRKYGIKEPYFICSNQFWLHKNHRLVLEAMKIAADRRQTFDFVFTGPTTDYRDPDYFGQLQRFADQGIAGHMRILGLVPKRDQIVLMRGAIALVQPTLIEGDPGGNSVTEALSVGQRVVVSDIPVNRELGAEAAAYFDPRNAEELFDALQAVRRSPAPKVKPGDLMRRSLERQKKCGRVLWDAFARAAAAERDRLRIDLT